MAPQPPQPRLLRYAAAHRRTLATNPDHGFAADYALCHYRAGAVYSFIPKNACSTLRLSLAIANGAIAGPEDWTWIHANNPTFRAALRDLATADFTFTVLRCPHARLASVFLDKIVGRSPEYWLLFRETGETIDPKRFSFRDFVGLVSADDDWQQLNEHWRPQVDFLVYAEYDAWYAVERMAEARDDLAARIGFDLVDARGLTRHGTDRFDLIEGDYADTSMAELAALQEAGRAPSHAALYDDALVGAVARAWACDLALYRDRIGAATLTFPDADFEPKET
ncbi:sulfotransferase family 2 domain-containing protein [Marinibacterium profundimaris]|uniref:Sulfotransferase family protein n=1 Tax=Marinibacterium profundimaris TaxID=1679460 RepID=A0A225NIT1_9RHOB|nr:sulfotransferase family 2 domain-containing protein [Marinibacterium profundimaris]MAU94899.1 hypothetical protein [Fulvimarina sp.]OWU68399.1 hypothetical protein ATO3_24250 [Marinibacterium profundimaris]